MFDFPASPSVGTIYAPGGGPTYMWDGTTWNIVESSAFQSGNFKVSSGVLAAAANAFDVALPAGYQAFELHLVDGYVSTYTTMCARFSVDGGVTFPSASNSYYVTYDSTGTSTAAGNWNAFGGTQAFITLGVIATQAAASHGFSGKIDIPIVKPAGIQSLRCWSDSWANTEYRHYRAWGMNVITGPATHIRIHAQAGTLDAGLKWQLNGIR